MEKYESKQHRINRPASQIYAVLSDFTNFTPIIADKVEGWQATEDSCTFRVKGITMRLNIIDKEPYSYIKFGGDDGSPLEFTMWIQLKEIAPYDTRMRIVLHAKLNMMMKMMLGSKLQEGVNAMAEQIAAAFNGTMPADFGNIEDIENMLNNSDIPNAESVVSEAIPVEEIEDADYTNIDFFDPSKPAS